MMYFIQTVFPYCNCIRKIVRLGASAVQRLFCLGYQESGVSAEMQKEGSPGIEAGGFEVSALIMGCGG